MGIEKIIRSRQGWSEFHNFTEAEMTERALLTGVYYFINSNFYEIQNTW